MWRLLSLVRAGARTASALPRDANMIGATVEAMNRAGSAIPKDSYEELWIYQANAAGYPGADGNTGFNEGTCTSNCVRYTWNEAGDSFEPASGTGWDETSINACPGEADDVGIYLRAKHDWVTGLFADETYVADRAVLKFEPMPANVTGLTCGPGV